MSNDAESNDQDRPAETAAGDQQLGLLRQLLFGDEQQRIEHLQERLDDPELSARDVARVLAEAIRIRAARDDKLGEALGPTISEAFDESVRRNPHQLADAISPIMGPAIRRSIAQTIRGMVQSLNRALETSFSLRGLKWRIESWRTGKSFGEIVLLHTLVYQVEQVFLIHRESGLLLQHVAAASVAVKDTDMVSGMLTAIQDFVQDSFGGSADEPLETMQVGEFTVWVEQGADAVLAVVVRGQPPETLHATLSESLESIHLEQRGELASFDGDAAVFERSRPHLEACLQTQFRQGENGKKSPKKALVVLGAVGVAVLLLAGYWAYNARQWRQRWTACVDRFRAEPGFVVIEAGRSGGKYRLAGLRDPLARQPEFVFREANFDAAEVVQHWRPYHSAEADFARQRTVNLDAVKSRLQELSAIIERAEAPDATKARFQKLVDRIDSEPGLMVTRADVHGGVFHITGLRDKHARDPETFLADEGLDGVKLQFHWRSFESPEPQFALARARQLLQPPAGVELTLDSELLRATGSAPREWIQQARRLAPSIAGIAALDVSALADGDAAWWEFVERLRSEPGIVVSVAEKRAEKYFVSGLRDALARDPLEIMQQTKLDPSRVTASWEPYQSLSPHFILLRARQQTMPPETVDLELEGGVLQVRGEARHDWIVNWLPRARWLAGVESMDSAGLVDLDERALSELTAEVERQVLYFEGGTNELVADSQQRLVEVAEKVKQLLAGAPAAQRSVQVVVIGHAANQGTDEFIQQTSESRALLVKQELAKQGIPADKILTRGAGASQPIKLGDTESDFAANRRVSLQVISQSAKLQP